MGNTAAFSTSATAIVLPPWNILANAVTGCIMAIKHLNTLISKKTYFVPPFISSPKFNNTTLGQDKIMSFAIFTMNFGVPRHLRPPPRQQQSVQSYPVFPSKDYYYHLEDNCFVHQIYLV